jgi:hypothetical protein
MSTLAAPSHNNRSKMLDANEIASFDLTDIP